MSKYLLPFFLSALLFAASCGGRQNAVMLDVDLYLHPESARGDDLVLQSAIQSRLLQDSELQDSLIHCRVIQGIVFLSGTVQKQNLREAAGRLAQDTEVTVNGRQIRATEPVRNGIEVPD
jgi:hypothetical protein